MSHIKKYFYLILFLPILLKAQDTASAAFQLHIPGIDKLTQTAVDLTESVDNFTKSVVGAMASWKPSGIGTLALVAGFYSARQLFSEYPKKPVAERTQSDWMIPTAGLTLSAGTLIYLWNLQNK